MKKTATVVLLFIVMIACSFAITKVEEPRYKNLKILPKNTTKQQLDSVMGQFSVSLGVKCNYCHLFNQEQKTMDFTSDANEHKGIARSMLKMMYKLNKKYFGARGGHYEAKLQVTCYTCHHGKTDPARFAGAMQGISENGASRPDTAKRHQ